MIASRDPSSSHCNLNILHPTAHWRLRIEWPPKKPDVARFARHAMRPWSRDVLGKVVRSSSPCVLLPSSLRMSVRDAYAEEEPPSPLSTFGSCFRTLGKDSDTQRLRIEGEPMAVEYSVHPSQRPWLVARDYLHCFSSVMLGDLAGSLANRRLTGTRADSLYSLTLRSPKISKQ